MKVNFGDKGKLQIMNILCGGTFVAQRSEGNGPGMYLKVDGNNKAPFLKSRGWQFCYAVNLETGQIREFGREQMVTPVKTEVNVVD